MLGGLYALGFILTLCLQLWLQAAGEAILLVPFGLTMLDRHKVLYRKILHYMYLVGTVLGAVLALIVIIVVAVEPDQMSQRLRDQCESDETLVEYYGSVSDCEESLYTMILWVVVVASVVGTLIRLAICRMLYYGWKEQEEYHRQRAVRAIGLNQP